MPRTCDSQSKVGILHYLPNSYVGRRRTTERMSGRASRDLGVYESVLRVELGENGTSGRIEELVRK